MHIDSLLSRYLAFPLNDIFKKTHGMKYYHTLEKTQWFTPSQIEKLQQDKLHALITFAYENVPYYRKVFNDRELKPSDVKGIEDLPKLPILTKEIIRNNSNSLISKSSEQKHKFSSGGTTGNPVVTYKDENSISWSLGAAYRGWNWGGYQLGDRYATLWRSPETISKYGKYNNKIVNEIRRNMLLPSFDLSEGNLCKHARRLKEFNPKILRSSPSAAYAMAEYMEARNNGEFNPVAVFTAAEKLYKFQRKKIESVFECEVFDSYGSNEVRSMAYECEEHNGYHISAENVIIEFIKESEQVSAGEFGEIIITDLTNYAMPLIRYKIGDIGIPSDQICTCGRGLPLIESIEGRSNSFVVTKGDKVLSSSYFSDMLDEFKYIKQFQIIQKDYNSLNIKLICSTEPTYREVNHVINCIKDSMKDDTDVKIELVKGISPAKSGKLQLVISEVPLRM